MISGNITVAVNTLKETSMIKSSRKDSRLHAWWPETNKDIKDYSKACTSYATAAQDLTRVPLHNGSYHYILSSKCTRILEMKSTTTEAIMG